MHSKLPLSIFIITFNEVDRIEAVLEGALKISDDVIVIDSGSTDGTKELVQKKGAKLLHRDWTGYGEQKRYGETQCQHDWMLNLDADEVMSQALIKTIQKLFVKGEPKHKAYSLSMVETFPHEKKPHAFAYAVKAVRLYHKGAGRYATSTVHDRVHLNDGISIGILKDPIYHYSVRSLGEQIQKLNTYSDMQAKDLIKRGKKPASWRIPLEFTLAFLKAYFIRRHCLRGLYGYMSAVNYAFSRHLRLVKHWERHNKALRGRAQQPIQNS